MDKIKDITKVIVPDEYLLVEDVTEIATSGGIIVPDSIKKKESTFKVKIVGRGKKVLADGDIRLGSYGFIITDPAVVVFTHNGKEYGIVHRAHVKMIVSPDNYEG
jgi:co-chaperonin GroES (HSP10)